MAVDPKKGGSTEAPRDTYEPERLNGTEQLPVLPKTPRFFQHLAQKQPDFKIQTRDSEPQLIHVQTHAKIMVFQNSSKPILRPEA